MFEEYVVGDLYSMNLVDYADSGDWVSDGGGTWHVDLTFPSETLILDRLFFWYHLRFTTNGTGALRFGMNPAVTARTIRINHAYTTSGSTWIGKESSEPVYLAYGTDTGIMIIDGTIEITRKIVGHHAIRANTHRWNATSDYHDYMSLGGDLSGVPTSGDFTYRFTASAVSSSGPPIPGRIEGYALAPRGIL